MKKRILTCLALVVLVSVVLSSFCACNNDKPQTIDTIEDIFVEVLPIVKSISANGTQNGEINLDVKNSKGWNISLECEGCVKTATFDKDNSKIVYTADPNEKAYDVFGAVTFIAKAADKEDYVKKIDVFQHAAFYLQTKSTYSSGGSLIITTSTFDEEDYLVEEKEESLKLDKEFINSTRKEYSYSDGKKVEISYYKDGDDPEYKTNKKEIVKSSKDNVFTTITYYYDWSSEPDPGEWVLVDQMKEEEIIESNSSTSISYNFDETKDEYIISFKSTLYNVSDNKEEVINIEYDEEGKFALKDKTISEKVVDGNDFVITERTYQEEVEDAEFKTLIGETVREYIENENGCVLTTTEKELYSDELTYTSKEIITISYVGKNTNYEIVSYSYYNNEWQLDSKNVMVEDEHGLILEDITEYYSEGKLWNKDKTEYTYNDLGNITEMKEYYYDTDEEEWLETSTSKYEYVKTKVQDIFQ